MSALPTREEIAEIIRQFNNVTGGDESETDLATADALLARLRPAWEQAARWKLVAETKGSMHDASTCTHAIEANRLKEERDALRVDLRACAEALEAQGMRSLDDPSDWCCCGHGGTFDGTPDSGHFKECRQARAALARPGVQAEIKK